MNIKTNALAQDFDALDVTANSIFNFYTSYLRENNYCIFSNDDGKIKTEPSDVELNIFKGYFKCFFKTKAQYRKTKDILNEHLRLELKDFYNEPYTAYFCLDKKKCEEFGNEYLMQVQNVFFVNIENKVRLKKG